MTEELIITAHRYAEDNRQKIADANPSITFEILKSLENLIDGDYITLSDCEPNLTRKVWGFTIDGINCFWGQNGVRSKGHSWYIDKAKIATAEQIKASLIRQATTKGWRGGDYRRPNLNWTTREVTSIILSRTHPYYSYDEGTDALKLNGRSVYRNGLWAERVATSN